jgi:hypothetical protein
MTERNLRLGIMCQGPSMPRWQALSIERMLATGLVELALVILDDPANYPTESLWQKVRRVGPSRLLFMTYLKGLFRPRSLVAADIRALISQVPSISCRVELKGRYSQYFHDSDVATIRSHDLDMILRFGFNIIRGDILQAARHGVWSFHHGDELKYRGGPPCFWEIYHRDPETGSVLQRLTERLDGGVVLKKGIFRTKMHSYRRNLDQAYLESTKWPAQVCCEIAAGTADYLVGDPTPSSAPIYRLPSNLQFAKAIWVMSAALARKSIARVFVFQRWNIALVQMPIERLMDAPPADLAGATTTRLRHRNADSFNADCFGVQTDQGTAVLFEELDYRSGGRGRIAACTIDRHGKESRRSYPTGLPADCHLSYPFLYREGTETYLIPETREQQSISLYRAIEFPFEWSKVADLLIGNSFVDGTLIRHDGLYWLFYAVHDDEHDADLHLHLAYCDRLEGPFTPHPGNPVKTSARSGRPGGTPFIDTSGRLIRPAQNFCRTYGGSIVFNCVTTLTRSRYSEEEVAELNPFDAYYRDGLHTVSAVDDETTLIDMKRHLIRLSWPWRRR